MTKSDIDVRFSRRSDQIGEAFLHFSELAETQPKKKAGQNEAEEEAGPIEPAFTPKQAPAETIDDADHGIEGVEKKPLVRDDPRAESDRRHIEAHLHQEWDDVPKIPILNV